MIHQVRARVSDDGGATPAGTNAGPTGTEATPAAGVPAGADPTAAGPAVGVAGAAGATHADDVGRGDGSGGGVGAHVGGNPESQKAHLVTSGGAMAPHDGHALSGIGWPAPAAAGRTGRAPGSVDMGQVCQALG